MRILLLHPEDSLPARRFHWDLIVDLARAPRRTYERWQSETRCRIMSLFDHADDVEDLHRLRELLAPGMRFLTDDYGVDWWDVLSVMIAPDLHMMMLAGRLFTDLGDSPVVETSRPHAVSRALSVWLEGDARNLQTSTARIAQRVGHYAGVFSRLRFSEMAQVAADKFDPTHSFRRRWSAMPGPGKSPAVLLPTAYSNTSTVAVAYARMLPDQRFLLVHARQQGKLQSLPPNVRATSLDPYFTPADQRKRTRQEIPQLLAGWKALKARLMESAPDYRAADAAGILDTMPGLLRWGTAARDAWLQVMNRENIVACLSADDGNPYSRLPLILASGRSLPTVACHHGAFDQRMAYKRVCSDQYLAKDEMERDYLERVCRVSSNQITLGGPSTSPQRPIRQKESKRSWLVWFTEPYEAASWRVEEIFRELAPALRNVAARSGLRLVLKLHPFESVKHRRSLLRRFLPADAAAEVDVIGTPLSEQLWQNVRAAVTVESTVALECGQRNVPVFLLAWLKSYRGGYQAHFAKFGVGQPVNSLEEVKQIPGIIDSERAAGPPDRNLWQAISPAKLGQLLGVESGEDAVHRAIPAKISASSPR